MISCPPFFGSEIRGCLLLRLKQRPILLRIFPPALRASRLRLRLPIVLPTILVPSQSPVQVWFPELVQWSRLQTPQRLFLKCQLPHLLVHHVSVLVHRLLSRLRV